MWYYLYHTIFLCYRPPRTFNQFVFHSTQRYIWGGEMYIIRLYSLLDQVHMLLQKRTVTCTALSCTITTEMETMIFIRLGRWTSDKRLLRHFNLYRYEYCILCIWRGSDKRCGVVRRADLRIPYQFLHTDWTNSVRANRICQKAMTETTLAPFAPTISSIIVWLDEFPTLIPKNWPLRDRNICEATIGSPPKFSVPSPIRPMSPVELVPSKSRVSHATMGDLNEECGSGS